MRIKFEKEIQDIKIRKQLIDEIEGSENLARKSKAFKRYQCYKDKTSEYVLENLLRQFDEATVVEMRYAIANVSIVRKIIDKLARVYSNGADRTGEAEGVTEKLQALALKLDLQSAMKKVNRFQKLQKNVALYVKPCPVYNLNGGVEKWTIELEILNPFLYDVVEDYYNRTKPLIWVLSSFKPLPLPSTRVEAQRSGAAIIPSASVAPLGDGKDQKIADTAADENQGERKTYIFWSKNYHFTCDSSGEIIADENNSKNENPFGVCPLLNFALDQDGAFWAEGGDDLVDGAVLINSLLTHVLHVGVVQGYGQFYMTGENLPVSVRVGPNKVIRAEYKKDEQAEPKFGFLNANPELDSMRGLVEMYLALLLTTNNLSTSGVATQLSGGQNLASGIALVIDKAESLEDVQDQQQTFIDKEADTFEVINAILKTYSSEMDEDLKDLTLPDNFEKGFAVKYHDTRIVMSEKEKLENMDLRKKLGLDTAISLLMKDNPSLSKQQAEAKFKEILEDRIKEKMMEQELLAKGGVEYDDQGNVITKPGDATLTGDPASTGTDPNVQQQSLNGAQVSAMIDIVVKVSAGEMPRDSAVQIIATAFNVTPDEADQILSDAGGKFKIEKPIPVPPIGQQNPPAPSDQNPPAPEPKFKKPKRKF